MGEPVRRADEREVAEPGLLELLADARERPARVEPLREHVEQRRPLLERLEQAAVRADLLGPHLVEQPGGAADVEPALLVGRLVERGADRRSGTPALARPRARLVEREPAPHASRSGAPTSRSLRYSRAQTTRPGSSGSANV